MKRILCVFLFASLATVGFTQEEKVFITSFEDSEELTGSWDNSWTGGSFQECFVDYGTDPAPPDGDAVLVIFYDNAGSTWQHSTFNFAVPAVDITGMREIHMSVYFTPESTGDLQIRMDLPNGNILGFADVPSAGEWHELVWKNRSENVSHGFLVGTYIHPRLYRTDTR